jgi:hypothetical protein
MYGFDNGTGICTGLFSTDVENPAGVEFFKQVVNWYI